ncbi:hypothetical protein K7X08_017745 [Anisodus acutangulus]|uniref:Uncharacterized protein n=1 Tax=Anisodus acutangulus TaxID=402998 RepID=A0A9Q1R8W0_9SOLA|nr:hypothetical protein K7X08_017745 [Anisodus acutangulus]
MRRSTNEKKAPAFLAIALSDVFTQSFGYAAAALAPRNLQWVCAISSLQIELSQELCADNAIKRQQRVHYTQTAKLYKKKGRKIEWLEQGLLLLFQFFSLNLHYQAPKLREVIVELRKACNA